MWRLKNHSSTNWLHRAEKGIRLGRYFLKHYFWSEISNICLLKYPQIFDILCKFSKRKHRKKTIFCGEALLRWTWRCWWTTSCARVSSVQQRQIRSMAASTGPLLAEIERSCLSLSSSVWLSTWLWLYGNKPECAVRLQKELKCLLTLFFQSSFAIYSELHALSWADVTNATDRAFLCAYLQPLQLE